ncbi:hypothetical protein LTS08_005410 [Lithohypha guttulata]|uniref:Uncharacterized protein n=1 Tax=Lithohypha guttulata TaxID=1690604 RepID=A0AAN7TF03_9EURO|nr:hypothetical protein LTR05_001834 [Lithohypha guttulata]KAK5100659.1 hypothetical protein LTS08_005410 [Lithohypha guttulata]
MGWSLGKSITRTTSQEATVTRASVSKLQHKGSHAEHPRHKPLPFLASPVDPEALKWIAKKKRSGNGVQRTTTVAQYEAEQSESALANRIFRKQHEASTLELFFDLFFVGNLAVFTTKSAHVDAQSLSNYLGFFAILWTTWFHVSMFDVRFYVDSVFTRICKFIAFGIMVSLVGLSSLYDSILSGGTTRAFHGIALLMFGCRILWIIQYAVVLYFVRAFDKTLVPMMATMFVYVAAAAGFLATFIMDRTKMSIAGTEGASKVRLWYIFICVEAVGVITISMVWRVLSFKHTHLVERVGLLSLIIMGEGIIGLIKSVSYAIQGTSVHLWEETGIITFAVLLIYLIYVLYFDNVDHHRFGTIGQQLWTLFHFPAHVCILLTVEGSTALLIWNACRNAIGWITEDSLPSATNPIRNPVAKKDFASLEEFVAQVNKTYWETSAQYYYKSLTEDYYSTTKFNEDLAKLSKPKASFGSDDWAAEVKVTLEKMSNYFQYFIYQNFGAEGPNHKLKKTKEYDQKVELYEDGYKFTLMYFYCSAGALLFVFALLYWFGRQKKTKTEWASIGFRILAGMGLPLMIISPLKEKEGDHDTFRYTFSYLLIPIVSLTLLIVIIIDNVLKAIAEKHYTVIEERRLSRMSSYDTTALKSPPIVEEEERELTDEDSSYELRRNTTQNGHGSPQMVQQEHDGASLVGNAQRTPTISFSDFQNRKNGYGEIHQDEGDDAPEYRRGDEEQHFHARRFQ